MRAAWVTAEAPDRRLGGGNIRQSHLLEALADEVVTDLVMLGPLEDDAVRRAVASVTELPPVPPMRWRTRLGRRGHDLAHAVAGRHPHEVVLERARRRALAEAVRSLPEVDVVYFEHAYLAPLAGLAPAPRRVVGFQTVPSRNVELALPLASGGRQRWLLERDLAKARRFEAGLCGAVDVVVAVSDEDAARLPGCTAVVPNGVDLDRYLPSPVPPAPNVVMTATFAFPPNADGARWFCNDVLPRVRRQVPSVRVDLVGRLPGADVHALAQQPGIEVHADVPDTSPHLQRARVAVVPIRMGAGTRLKALEAMAAGRPVVGTRLGLEGLGAVDGRHALVADEADAFAAAVVDLLVHDELAARLARAGRQLVEGGFGWRQLGRRFVDVVVPGRDAGP